MGDVVPGNIPSERQRVREPAWPRNKDHFHLAWNQGRCAELFLLIFTHHFPAVSIQGSNANGFSVVSICLCYGKFPVLGKFLFKGPSQTPLVCRYCLGVSTRKEEINGREEREIGMDRWKIPLYHSMGN